MLSISEHPGIFSFLIGIVVLVMSAVGLSLLVDRRFEFSSSSLKIQREIELGAMELEDLSVLYDKRHRILNESGPEFQARSVAYKSILTELEVLGHRQTSLEKTRSQLRDQVARTNEDFSNYRAEYRRRTWAAAIGQRLGDFVLRDGREYKQAAITRVTDVGLEIRHEDGIARIQAPDLDSKLQDRFQWSDEERRQVLGKEQQDLEGKANEAVPDNSTPADWNSKSSVTEVSRFQSGIAPDSAEVAALRQLVSAWLVKVSLLSGEHQEATSRAGYGSQSSVPGSLETWSARASRLGKALARAQGELAVAKARLAAVAPSDPLLRPSLQGR